MTTVQRDRLRTMIDAIVDSLADAAKGEELARRVHLSRFHFDRLLAAAIGETPVAFRRRLMLERAARDLSRGGSVLEAAFEAGYSSPEAFARAFRRTYGCPPSAFEGDFRLPAPNGVHFHPPGGLLIPGDDERRKTVDLTERMVEHDIWLTRRMLEAAESLEDRLDEPFAVEPNAPHAFPSEKPSVREMLDRLILSKEVWTAALAGLDWPQERGMRLPELRGRFESSAEEWRKVVRDARDRGAWDTAFVDVTCEPPQSFTYGGMVAHVLTWSAHRRHVLIGALNALGAEVGSGDPLEWEQPDANAG
jgi:AraC family transcriptional regulator